MVTEVIGLGRPWVSCSLGFSIPDIVKWGTLYRVPCLPGTCLPLLSIVQQWGTTPRFSPLKTVNNNHGNYKVHFPFDLNRLRDTYLGESSLPFSPTLETLTKKEYYSYCSGSEPDTFLTFSFSSSVWESDQRSPSSVGSKLHWRGPDPVKDRTRTALQQGKRFLKSVSN